MADIIKMHINFFICHIISYRKAKRKETAQGSVNPKQESPASIGGGSVSIYVISPPSDQNRFQSYSSQKKKRNVNTSIEKRRKIMCAPRVIICFSLPILYIYYDIITCCSDLLPSGSIIIETVKERKGRISCL